jgi:hypothetical protein
MEEGKKKKEINLVPEPSFEPFEDRECDMATPRITRDMGRTP